MNTHLIQESTGFTPKGKFHISALDKNEALCGSQPRMSAHWNVTASRDDFERLLPERICKRCRKSEGTT